MFEFLTTNPAVALLKEDHDRVKELFERFEEARTRPAKVKIVRAALIELKVHAAIEEELFYPAVRKSVGKEIMNEADEEHHVAKLLIAELDTMDGSESHYDAKFHVLAENVRHHIKEEEGEMLPKAQKVKLDFAALAEKMCAPREKLLDGGVPPVGEEAMVKASRGKGDSPTGGRETEAAETAEETVVTHPHSTRSGSGCPAAWIHGTRPLGHYRSSPRSNSTITNGSGASTPPIAA